MGSSHFVRTVRSLSRAGYVFPTSWPEGLRCCAQFPVAVPCTRPCHPVGGGGRGFLSCGPPCGGPRDSSRDRPVPRLPLLGVAKCRLAVSARPLPGGWAASAVGCSHDLASLPPYARISNREGGGSTHTDPSILSASKCYKDLEVSPDSSRPRSLRIGPQAAPWSYAEPAANCRLAGPSNYLETVVERN